MTAALVSIVLPVYNGQAYLRQAVESVLSQKHAPLELIAIDDGSTDGSAAILAGYGDRIVVIRQENSGVAAARNAGIERARGEFVAFLDQDDWWLPEKIARQVALFQRNERLGLVHTAASFYDESRDRFMGHPDPEARPEAMVGNCYEALLLCNPLVNSSVMVRRAALQQVGSCDLQIRGNTVQDYDLWLRIAKRFQFDHVAEPLSVFRIHGAQGHCDRRAMLSEELKLLLRQFPATAWRATPQRRRRLADVSDSLATAHLEASEPHLARRFFAQAMRLEPSRRRLTRFGASCLPAAMLYPLRRAWQKRKLRQALTSSSPESPPLADSVVKC